MAAVGALCECCITAARLLLLQGSLQVGRGVGNTTGWGLLVPTDIHWARASQWQLLHCCIHLLALFLLASLATAPVNVPSMKVPLLVINWTRSLLALI
jgi:hypothetical protein